MSKIIGMTFIALLVLLSAISNVQGVVNFELAKSYIQEALEAFREIVNNAELTDPIHDTFQQQTQVTAVYEPLAAAADAAYAQYDPLLRNENIVQKKWRKIRSAHIRYTIQIFEFCQNEQINTEEVLRIPMEAFEQLYALTEIRLGSLDAETVTKRVHQEQQLTYRMMAELALRRNQRGVDMGLPNPNDPYHGFNPIEDNSNQDGGTAAFSGSSSSTYYGGSGSEGNPASSSNPNPGFDGGNPSAGYYGYPAVDPNDPNSPYYGNFGFDPNTDPRNRRQGD